MLELPRGAFARLEGDACGMTHPECHELQIVREIQLCAKGVENRLVVDRRIADPKRGSARKSRPQAHRRDTSRPDVRMACHLDQREKARTESRGQGQGEGRGQGSGQ